MNATHAEKRDRTIRQDLHDMSQPLTRLQWRLELGRRSENPDDLRETIEGAIGDSVELIAWITRLRATLEKQTQPTEWRAA